MNDDQKTVAEELGIFLNAAFRLMTAGVAVVLVLAVALWLIVGTGFLGSLPRWIDGFLF